jgi:hypothetical protein
MLFCRFVVLPQRAPLAFHITFLLYPYMQYGAISRVIISIGRTIPPYPLLTGNMRTCGHPLCIGSFSIRMNPLSVLCTRSKASCIACIGSLRWSRVVRRCCPVIPRWNAKCHFCVKVFCRGIKAGAWDMRSVGPSIYSDVQFRENPFTLSIYGGRMGNGPRIELEIRHWQEERP